MRLTVVALGYQSRADLRDCLDSIRRQRRSPDQVIAVDNGSTDGSADMVRREFPEVELLALPENLGFCRANNQALQRSRGAAILFVNADVELDPGFTEEILRPPSRDDGVGLVGGKLLRKDQRTLDSAGQVWDRDRRIRDRGYGQLDCGQFDEPAEVASCCGAALLCRRAMIESIAPDGALFDPDFFAFGEDLDLGLRARAAGWKVIYWPGAIAYHRRGGTQVGRPRFQLLGRPPEIRYHILKNRYLLLLKHEHWSSLWPDLPHILLFDLILWGALLATSPRVLVRLLSDPRPFRRAWARRRELGRPGRNLGAQRIESLRP